MKNKHVMIIGAVIVAICCVVGLVACERNNIPYEPHKHNYSSTIIEPTCTEQGYTFYVCDCGDSYKDNYVEALGHDFKNYVSNNDATYETDGTKTAICERDGCNEKDTVVDVGSTLHKHNYSSTITEPTCTEQGYPFYVCDCGDSYKDNYVEALGHDFKNYVSNNDATYETDGTKTAICERDGCNEKNTIVDEGTKIEKVKIVFNSDGGTAVESIIEYPNTEIVCPENPIKENYLFKKWQLDGKDYTFTTMPEKDIELTAVWEFYEDGTKLYLFVIECKEDYFEFVNNINKGINTDKYYILKNDIDFEGQPVNSVTEFSGVFDGRNFELRNAIIAEEVVLSQKYYFNSGKGFFGQTTAMGLFIRLNEKAIIMNTRLINFSILNEDITADYVHVGGLVSINLGGTIKNCQTKGTIEIRQSLSYQYNSTVFAGGLIGSNGSMIIVSSVTSSSASYEYVLSTSPSVCEESYSNVSIDDQSRSSSSRIGGLCGRNSGTICTSFSLGKIGSRHCSGGLVGENYGQISNCFSKATVVSSDSQIYSSCYAGGLVGINNAGKISFCYASGNVSASGGYSAPGGACAGGLVGFFESGNIYSCLAINLNISCNDRDNIDAFVGNSKGAAAITNSFYYGASNVTSRYAEECLHMQLNDKSFYINTLGWDNMIWDLNELNILTSNAPQLNWYLNEIVILRDR